MNKTIAIVIAGILFAVATVSVLYFSTAKKTKNTQVIAPYYEPTVFMQPIETLAPTVPFSNTTPTPLPKFKLPIVMYHYVKHEKETDDLVIKRLDISPYVFEQHLQSLQANNYETHFVKDIPAIINHQTLVSNKSVVLTFDDGYEDFYTEVLPLLSKYNMKATVYVIYNYIGRPGFLTKTQLQEIIATGLVEVGSHALDHIHLAYASPTYAHKQIFDSKTKLEEMFHLKIETFAYPYGSMSPQVIEMTKQASYSASVSVINGAFHDENDLFSLHRIRAGALGGRDAVTVLENFNK